MTKRQMCFKNEDDMRENELLIYKNFGEDGQLLEDMAWLMGHYKDEYYNAEDIKSLLQPYKHDIVDFLKKYGIDNGGDWYFFIEVGYADEDGILYGGFGVSTLEDNQPECTYSHKHCVNHEDGEYIMFDFDWLQEV